MSAPIVEEPEDGATSERSRRRRRVRPVEIKVARIAAYAAVGGAVLAVGAAVIGALIAGQYTSATTDKQISATRDQNLIDFLRQQRQQLYASLIVDGSSLDHAESTYLLSRGSGSVDVINKAKSDLDNAYDKFRADVSGVSLVCSPATLEITNKLFAYHYTIRINIGGEILGDPQAISDSHDKSTVLATSLFNQRENILRDEPKFLDEARIDLGSAAVG